MAVKFNSVARGRAINVVYPKIPEAGGGFQDVDFYLSLYSWPLPSHVSSSAEIPEYGKVAQFFLRLSLSDDGRMVFLRSNYEVTTALNSGRIQSWILSNTNNNPVIGGVSVATQASGNPAHLILNSLDAVKDSPVQLVDFSFKLG